MATKTTETKSEPVKVEATPAQPETKKKSKGGFGKGLIAGCILVLLCLCVCCFSAFFFFGSLFSLAFSQVDDINAQVLNEVCNVSDSELRDVYNNNFTSRYQNEVSYTEFRSFYKENKNVFGACEDKLSNIKARDFLDGFSFSYQKTNGEETVDLSVKVDSEKLSMKVVKDGNDWLIDELNVEK